MEEEAGERKASEEREKKSEAIDRPRYYCLGGGWVGQEASTSGPPTRRLLAVTLERSDLDGDHVSYECIGCVSEGRSCTVKRGATGVSVLQDVAGCIYVYYMFTTGW